MACPLARGAFHGLRHKAINSRTGEGQPGRCPFKSREKWAPREHAALFCSPPCHCSAQAPHGLRITPFSPRSLPRSVSSPFSAPQGRGTGADMDKDYLTLKRVPTRASVEDYDVLCG